MRNIILLFFVIHSILLSSQEIKIVYNTDTPPLKFTDKNNQANGMLIDIWRLWAKKNNLEIKFIEASWEDTIKMIKDGRADIHAGIYYTKQRDKFLDYTNKPLYENKSYFFYKDNIENIQSTQDLKPYVIGIGNGYPSTYMDKNFPNFTYKKYQNSIKLNEAFSNDEIKVILSSFPTLLYYLKQNDIDETQINYSDNTKAYIKKYYGAVKQNNKKLLKLINNGFLKISNKELKNIELKWTRNLQTTYLKNKQKNSNYIALQQTYLKQKKQITMCVDPAWMPFESIKDKQHIGIVADIFKEIQKNLMIPIKLLPTKTWSESLDKAKNRQCDILSAVAITPQRKQYLNFTKTYLKFPQVIVTRENTDFIENFDDILHKKIGSKKSAAITELLKLKYPDINLVETKDVEEALFKVSNGELFGFVNTTASISYNISRLGLTNLKIASKVGITYHLKVGVRNDNQLLLNIMNTAISKLDKTKIEDIKRKWLKIKIDKIVNYALLWKIIIVFLFILSIIGIFIWKQNKLKKLLQEQKYAFENIFEKSTDPILLIDNGNFIDCNEAALKILKIKSKEQLLNIHPSNLSPKLQPDGQNSLQKANQLMQEAVNKGFSHFEWVHTNAIGEDFWVDVVLTKININDKDIIHVLWRDIQKRKEIEANLNKFSQIIQQSHVSVLITNPDGLIEYANPYCLQKIGYTHDELLGKNPRIFKSNEHEEAFYKKLWDTITSGQTWQGDFLNKTKSNQTIWEHTVITPIFNEDDEIVHYASIKEDITEKKELDKKLIIAQKDAHNANRAKSDFLAKMSHEIRTPMNAVLGMLYLVQQTKLTSSQENYINKASNAANSLLGIINDILDFSKIEANKLEIKKSEFNINQLISESLSVMGFNASKNELELLSYCDREIPSNLISDKLRINQILTNLISNAIKFTLQGEILVSVKLLKQVNDNVTLLFCIKDSGIGISSENQKKLFTEFSQVDNSQTRSFQGTGLGLAISAKLANLLGGEIWIEESIENVGSTFCFTIEAQVSKNQPKNEFNFTNNLENLKVLIVDDNSLAIEVLTYMLESFHYNVDSSKSGYEAIKKVSNKNYDLIFLDYKMPELNGIETYVKIKELKKDATPKTIMVTAYTHDIVHEELEKLGIDGYLSKPISSSTLFDKITEVFNGNNIHNEDKQKIDTQVFKDINILLVEDNPLNQEFASIMLQNKGCNVRIANDGIEALQIIKNKNFDAILMDIQMPNMDGIEATKKIRAMDDDYFKKVPIIALSANALLGDKEKSISAGMNDHITKPINPDLLFKTLGDILSIKLINTSNKNQIKTKYVHKLDKQLFNIEEALHRVNYDETTYIKLLKQFKQKYQTIMKDINDLKQNKDINKLQEKIHEIKGIAGNLSISTLFQLLSSINHSLKNYKIPQNDIFEQLDNSFNNVFEQISNLESVKIKKQNFDKAKVIKLLDKIKANLEVDIVECENNLELVLPYLEDEYKEFSNQLNDALNQYDLDMVNDLITNLLMDLNNE